MLPVIALVGRPNVGKSTLFNRLTRSRAALVANTPGLTRDRQYGEGRIGEQRFIVIDTGGLGEEEAGVDELMRQQTQQALLEADLVVFMVDARSGLSSADEIIAADLRRQQKPIFLVVNKIDGVDPNLALAEFHSLGYANVWKISASHGRGVELLFRELAEHFPDDIVIPEEQTPGIKVAVVGRPNVGKSTLINRILGEERVVVFDAPGTTRDSIFIPFERRGQDYTLIDTAGVRRRGRVSDTVEKFSVIKALQAIESANVVVLLVDAQEGITGQDLHLLGFVLETGKSLVIAFNKWDGIPQERKDWLRREFQRRLVFVEYAKWHMISALHGTGVGDLFGSIQAAYKSAMKQCATSELTRLLEKAVQAHQPPLSRGRRIKLRYAHAGGHNPPIIVIHGNQVDRLPASYQRYLENYFRKALKLVGTPIRFELKKSENPFEGKRNKLTPRQQQKRKRMMQHVKGKK